MKRFYADNYYTFEKDNQRGVEKEYAEFTRPGLNLLAQFYAKKYDSKIRIPFFNDYHQLLHSPLLAEIRQQNKDTREAFIIGVDNHHAVPVVYIRENGQEAFLHLNSLGFNAYSFDPSDNELPIYTVDVNRQADSHSCFIDATVMCKDMTRINAVTGKYYVPDLLAFLQKHSTGNDKDFSHIHFTSLPNHLLKTSQMNRFVKFNVRQNPNTTHAVHKHKDIASFRKDYLDDKESYRHSYLRKKGIKLTHTIQIQFYLDQIEETIQASLTKQQRELFIEAAKVFFKMDKNVDLYDLANEYADLFRLKQHSSNDKPLNTPLLTAIEQNDNEKLKTILETSNDLSGELELGLILALSTKKDEAAKLIISTFKHLHETINLLDMVCADGVAAQIGQHRAWHLIDYLKETWGETEVDHKKKITNSMAILFLYAAIDNNLDVINLLIGLGVTPNYRHELGNYYLLDYAIIHENIPMIEKILSIAPFFEVKQDLLKQVNNGLISLFFEKNISPELIDNLINKGALSEKVLASKIFDNTPEKKIHIHLFVIDHYLTHSQDPKVIANMVEHTHTLLAYTEDQQNLTLPIKENMNELINELLLKGEALQKRPSQTKPR